MVFRPWQVDNAQYVLNGGKPSKLTIQARNRDPSPGVGICLRAESSGLKPEEEKGWLERLRSISEACAGPEARQRFVEEVPLEKGCRMSQNWEKEDFPIQHSDPVLAPQLGIFLC